MIFRYLFCYFPLFLKMIITVWISAVYSFGKRVKTGKILVQSIVNTISKRRYGNKKTNQFTQNETIFDMFDLRILV